MSELLKKLNANRDFILMAEIGSLIHDIGKLDERWPGRYNHSDAILDINVCKQDLCSLIDTKNCDKQLIDKINQASFCKINDFINKHHKDGGGPLNQLIRLADQWSSTDDRYINENDISEEMKQEGPLLFASNSFGKEEEINRSGLKAIKNVIEEALRNSEKRYKIGVDFARNTREYIRVILKNNNAIASTHRPSNDVALMDHSFSTAAIFKAFLNQWILGKSVLSKTPYGNQNQDYLGICAIYFDWENLFVQSEKIGDLAGRLEAFKKVQEDLNNVIEIEYAAGNEIYRETGLSCFLLPVQFVEEGKQELEAFLGQYLKEKLIKDKLLISFWFKFEKTQWIHKTLHKVLTGIRRSSLPTNPDNIDIIQKQWNKATDGAEICPLCGLLPGERNNNEPRNKRLCEFCDHLRIQGQEKRRKINEHTIWMAEIADLITNRVAILSIEVPLELWLQDNGMLQLHQFQQKNKEVRTKTLSYERIRRFWAATDEYLQEVEKRVREELGTNERLKLDLELINQSQKMEQGQFYLVQGPEQSEVYLSRSNDDQLKFQTVTRLRYPENWQKGGEICLQEDRLQGLKFQARIKDIHTEKYYPLTKVFQSQNHLILIVPAKEARNLALAAMDLFERRFSKALGKLPLSIGMIYAPVKLPLSLSLQAMFKMQRYLRQQANQLQTAEVIEKKEENGKMAVKLNLKAEGVPEAEIGLTIDTVLGDNDSGKFEKQDVFYTRLPVICDKSKPGERNILQKVSLWDANECTPVLAHELNCGDRLRILLGAFDFEFLESAARRFNLHLNKDKPEGKRTAHQVLGSQGPRPFNIFHLKLMADLEELLKKQPDITDTHLKNIYQLLVAKAAEWDLDKAPKGSEIRLTYENLVTAVLAKEFRFSAPEREFFKQTVLSGLFFDWMELFYQIEKRKLREGNIMTDPFRKEQYLMLALDPIHIGTGGYRLGRVDNTIIREPGTNLPKVPGTSLSGALRSFMAMQNKNKYPSCAGQGQEDEKTKEIRHCGEATCPVCMSFGFSYSRNSFQGLVQLSDAYLLFFPVYSRLGPVWITSPAALETAGFNGFQTGDNEVKTVSSLKEKAKGKLNLGWLMLPVAEEEFEIPKKLDDKDKIPESILNRAVLVSDSLFSHIVNDNLEVRTSVAIDPDTGAAADKALFTYEAIPRTAVLQFYATITEPQLFKVPPENKKPDFNIDKLSANLSKASEYLQWLGIGGMNTRGMGRMRTLARLEAGKNE